MKDSKPLWKSIGKESTLHSKILPLPKLAKQSGVMTEGDKQFPILQQNFQNSQTKTNQIRNSLRIPNNSAIDSTPPFPLTSSLKTFGSPKMQPIKTLSFNDLIDEDDKQSLCEEAQSQSNSSAPFTQQNIQVKNSKLIGELVKKQSSNSSFYQSNSRVSIKYSHGQSLKESQSVAMEKMVNYGQNGFTKMSNLFLNDPQDEPATHALQIEETLSPYINLPYSPNKNWVFSFSEISDMTERNMKLFLNQKQKNVNEQNADDDANSISLDKSPICGCGSDEFKGWYRKYKKEKPQTNSLEQSMQIKVSCEVTNQLNIYNSMREIQQESKKLGQHTESINNQPFIQHIKEPQSNTKHSREYKPTESRENSFQSMEITHNQHEIKNWKTQKYKPKLNRELNSEQLLNSRSQQKGQAHYRLGSESSQLRKAQLYLPSSPHLQSTPLMQSASSQTSIMLCDNEGISGKLQKMGNEIKQQQLRISNIREYYIPSETNLIFRKHQSILGIIEHYLQVINSDIERLKKHYECNQSNQNGQIQYNQVQKLLKQNIQLKLQNKKHQQQSEHLHKLIRQLQSQVNRSNQLYEKTLKQQSNTVKRQQQPTTKLQKQRTLKGQELQNFREQQLRSLKEQEELTLKQEKQRNLIYHLEKKVNLLQQELKHCCKVQHCNGCFASVNDSATYRQVNIDRGQMLPPGLQVQKEYNSSMSNSQQFELNNFLVFSKKTDNHDNGGSNKCLTKNIMGSMSLPNKKKLHEEGYSQGYDRRYKVYNQKHKGYEIKNKESICNVGYGLVSERINMGKWKAQQQKDNEKINDRQQSWDEKYLKISTKLQQLKSSIKMNDYKHQLY